MSCLNFWAEAQTAVTDGVSHELAIKRQSQVANVLYTLHFEIPFQKEVPVTGTAKITFDWKGGKEDLQIDFQGKVNGPVVVNGKSIVAAHQAEHVIIPAKKLSGKKPNEVRITFRSEDNALNRNADYMYTLFVPDHARSAFPCFDQPDIKARYRLSLTLPQGWTAISNSPLFSTDGQTLQFGLSDLLPTYLFSFTAGRFETQTSERDGRMLTALYRETDPRKVAQLGTVFDQVALSLRWMEEFTGIPQPF